MKVGWKLSKKKKNIIQLPFVTWHSHESIKLFIVIIFSLYRISVFPQQKKDALHNVMQVNFTFIEWRADEELDGGLFMDIYFLFQFILCIYSYSSREKLLFFFSCFKFLLSSTKSHFVGKRKEKKKN
jgi:hypothetical protein